MRPNDLPATVADVVRAVRHFAAAPSWAQCAARISEERTRVEEYIARGGAAYGFTTRLGHLDNEILTDQASSSLLTDHLHGRRWAFPPDVIRLVTAVKVAQLSAGGSGVSRELFARLLVALEDHSEGAVFGAWDASYGSGDVVPAAWWLRHVLGDDSVQLRPGDVIAAINGNFFSTAVSISVVAEALDTLAHYLAILPAIPLDVAPRSEPAVALHDLLRDGGESDSAGPQRAVSERDSSPYLDAVVQMLCEVSRSLSLRLRRATSNPHFYFDVDAEGHSSVRAVSQNGFLDFDLSMSLDRLLAVLQMAAAHTQRLLEWHCARASAPALVQVPKVADSLVARASTLHGPRVFGFAASQGIEDMRDFTLTNALVALDGVRLLREVLDLCAGPGLGVRRDVREIRSQLWLLLGVQDAPPPGAMYVSGPGPA